MVCRLPSQAHMPTRRLVLILSQDAVAAALLGALVETLGYLVQFHRPPGDARIPDPAQPSVAMVNCNDPSLLTADLLGRTQLRGGSVVIFGVPDAITRVRTLAREFGLHALLMPVSLDVLDETLRQGIARVC
jgi:hypothetical protein